MLNCRYRRCCCMNNNCCGCNSNSCNINAMNNNFDSDKMNSCNSNILEDSCNNVSANNTDFNTNCSCGFDDDTQKDIFPSCPMLAQSYVPTQFMNETLRPCTGLDNGTIFPELISPYSTSDNMRQNAYIECTNASKEGCNS